jgi:hypothetical protein
MIQNIRYRVEGELVVLQVLEIEEADIYSSRRNVAWRDAKVEDLLDVPGFITKTIYVKEVERDCVNTGYGCDNT